MLPRMEGLWLAPEASPPSKLLALMRTVLPRTRSLRITSLCPLLSSATRLSEGEANTMNAVDEGRSQPSRYFLGSHRHIHWCTATSGFR